MGSREEAAELLQQLMGIVNGRGGGSESLRLQHEAGLTFPQIIALYHLRGSREPQTVSNLAEVTGLSLGATSQLVDRMVGASLVTRIEDAEDRRVRIVSIAPKGKALLARLHGIRNKEWQATIGRLSPQLQQRLVEVMREVAAALNQ